MCPWGNDYIHEVMSVLMSRRWKKKKNNNTVLLIGIQDTCFVAFSSKLQHSFQIEKCLLQKGKGGSRVLGGKQKVTQSEGIETWKILEGLNRTVQKG